MTIDRHELTERVRSVLNEQRLRAENERLTKERDNWKAHAVSRGKRLRLTCDKFINIRDEIEDEGDRVYFGSTNHADQFKEEVAWLDDFAWDKIMGEPEDWDLLGALEKQKARAQSAAAALDGGYDAGVEAAKEVVKFHLGDLIYTPGVLDALEKLKKVTP